MCVLQHMSLMYMLLQLCISIILVAAPPARPSVRVCVGLFQTPRSAGEGVPILFVAKVEGERFFSARSN